MRKPQSGEYFFDLAQPLRQSQILLEGGLLATECSPQQLELKLGPTSTYGRLGNSLG